MRLRRTGLAAAWATSGLLLLASAGHAAPLTPEASVSREAVVQRAIESVIRPGYEQLDKAGEAEAKNFAALCAKPSAEALREAREGFASFSEAFGAVEFIRFGPIMEGERFDRFLFWPDRREATQRQAQIIVNRRDVDATTSDLLPRKSAAVQGLTALEYVLFGRGSDMLADRSGAFRCRYGATIVDNLGQISDAVAEQWRDPHGISERLLKPNPSDPRFRSEADALKAILDAAISGLQTIREERILPGLNARDGATAANLFLFGRSGHATAMLAADLGGLRVLLEESGLLDLASAPAPSPSAELGAIALSLRTLGPELGDVSETLKGEAVLREALVRIEAVELSLRTDVALGLGLAADPRP